MPIKKVMKTIVIFYDDPNSQKYSENKAFAGESARELSRKWAEKLKLSYFYVKSSTLIELLQDISRICSENQAENAAFTYSDLPFLNEDLSKKLIDTHIKYKAEYTFSDGYPYGFAPELINADTANILAAIAETQQQESGRKPVTRDGLYNLIKTDINSFDVETVLADFDYRLYRLAFHCGSKDNFLQCEALADSFSEEISSFDVEKLSQSAINNPSCLKTVPGFYNIQISGKLSYDAVYSPYPEEAKKHPCGEMSYSQYETLVEKISAFSEKAVISLSAFGEAFANPDFIKIVEKTLSYDGLSVFVETDGLYVSEEISRQLSCLNENVKERTNGWPKIMIAVALDAFTEQTYQKLHKNAPEGSFNRAVEAVKLLSAAIPGAVYPQFVRMNENEAELEAFYRYWNEKANASKGNLISQKYDDFAGSLPPCKPADLSPLVREPCWHLRRDMTILSNGDVPLCHSHIFNEIQGNVFTDSLEAIWKKSDTCLQEHIKCRYCGKCEKCDEWYTFNF